MCKYCEEHWVEEYKEYTVVDLSERTESRNNRDNYTGIQSFVDPDTRELVIIACLDNEHVKPLIGYKHIAINYCPICGRKLGE